MHWLARWTQNLRTPKALVNFLYLVGWLIFLLLILLSDSLPNSIKNWLWEFQGIASLSFRNLMLKIKFFVICKKERNADRAPWNLTISIVEYFHKKGGIESGDKVAKSNLKCLEYLLQPRWLFYIDCSKDSWYIE